MVTRLKSLELHGYKTFASRVVFEFPGNITAIVGPNGSGKSNVADSLRWVLGEQSYSLLRGRKTEDMIFSGSEQRPRSGMALASIVFNNEDGWLPIDFAEVAVARRAYRDGDNEYWLNGQRVRLKEISELLAQSGLAERTYTIIGQGLVDSALSLKPEERRRFFEEAAGIGLYRSRREEALNRLDATRRNLERVVDILSELEPRLKSLERQAQRAIEYERVKADLRLLLRDWYGYHWHALQRDLKQTRDVVQVQDLRLEQTRQRLEAVEVDLTQQRQGLQAARNELNGWHAQLAGLHGEWEKVSRTLAIYEERQRAMQDQEQSAGRDLARLEDEHKAQQARMAAIEEEQERLEEELQEGREQAAGAQRALEARQRQRVQVEQELRDTRRQMTSAETQQVQRKAHQNELKERIETLLRSQQSLQQEVQGAQNAVEAAQKKLEQMQAERQTLEAARAELDAALHAAQKQAQTLEEQRRQLLEERGRLDAERSRTQAQLDVLEQAERSMSGLNQGARTVLQAARTGKLPGGYQPLSSLMEAPARYETALAAALGESLDAVLLSAQTDPEPTLLLLEANGAGRVVLYPLDWLAKPQMPPSFAAEGVQRAADVVRVADEAKPALEALLGMVWIVEDRAAARRLWADLPRGGRLVTLRGEVFNSSGAVIAGQEGRGSLVGRPRQKRELGEMLAGIQAHLERVVLELRTQEEAIAGQRTLVLEAQKAQQQTQQQVQAAERAQQQALLALEQARQRQEWQRKQAAGIEEQVQRAHEEATRDAQALEKAAATVQALSQQVRSLQHKLDGLPLDELQGQVVHWNTSVAVADRAVREIRRRQQEFTQVLNANTQQQAAARQRQMELRQTMQQLEQERSLQRQRDEQLNQAIAALQAQIDPAEGQLQMLEQGFNEAQERQIVAQQAVTVAERHASQAQMELTRQREALDALRRRIEEDFGLVALEYTSVAGPAPLPLDGMVEELPGLPELPPGLEDTIQRQRAQLRRMGAVNPDAQTEYRSVKERYEFLTVQVADLKRADADLRQVIGELDALMKKEFKRTFDAVAAEFRQMFTRLFGGGSARLVMTDEDNPTETGIDIEARLPGRREQGLSLLSGGERSLTAVALVFSLLKVSPTPFCVLDEVDAMLDEANVGRFCDLLRELSQNTQFVVITHNRNTVQAADVIYGVTMGRDSSSQVISLRLDEVSEDMVH